jgi:hypothetical protein
MPIYFLLSTWVLLSVGREPTPTAYAERGALFYNALTLSSHRPRSSCRRTCRLSPGLRPSLQRRFEHGLANFKSWKPAGVRTKGEGPDCTGSCGKISQQLSGAPAPYALNLRLYFSMNDLISFGNLFEISFHYPTWIFRLFCAVGLVIPVAADVIK